MRVIRRNEEPQIKLGSFAPSSPPAVLHFLTKADLYPFVTQGLGNVCMCARAQSLSLVPLFPTPWSVARIWGRVCARTCAHTPSLSHGLLFATPWSVARQAPLSMGFSR